MISVTQSGDSEGGKEKEKKFLRNIFAFLTFYFLSRRG